MRVEIWGGPLDGRVIDVRDEADHLRMLKPDVAALGGGPDLPVPDVIEVELPIVEGPTRPRVLWPKEAS